MLSWFEFIVNLKVAHFFWNTSGYEKKSENFSCSSPESSLHQSWIHLLLRRIMQFQTDGIMGRDCPHHQASCQDFPCRRDHAVIRNERKAETHHGVSVRHWKSAPRPEKTVISVPEVNPNSGRTLFTSNSPIQISPAGNLTAGNFKHFIQRITSSAQVNKIVSAK